MKNREMPNRSDKEKKRQVLQGRSTQRISELGGLKLEDYFYQISADNSPENFITIIASSKFSHFVNDSQKVDMINKLQQTYGNMYLQRIIQPNLKIDKSNDKYEHEANKIADEVMKISEPQVRLHKKKSKEEFIKKQLINEESIIHEQIKEEELFQAKLDSDSISKLIPKEQSYIDIIFGISRTLPDSLLNFFESRFGFDFSQVRIHTDSHAMEKARLFNARAFTIGNNIVFGAGQYAPNNTIGKRLLAHELMHIIQQTKMPQIPKGYLFRQVEGEHEKEPVERMKEVKGETSEKAKGKKAVRFKITQIKEYSTKFNYFSYENSGMSARVSLEYLNAAERLMKIAQEHYLSQKWRVEIPEEQEPKGIEKRKPIIVPETKTYKKLKDSVQDFKDTADEIIEKAKRAKFKLKEPTVKPVQGKIIFKVEALPKDVQTHVKFFYHIKKWYSTRSFGDDLGKLSPTSAKIGTILCTIELNGNLASGIFGVYVDEPPYHSDLKPFEVVGMTEEIFFSELLKHFINHKDNIEKAKEDFENANKYLDIASKLIKKIPKIGDKLSEGIDLISSFSKIYISKMINKEKEINLKQAMKNIIALEGLPERAHSTARRFMGHLVESESGSEEVHHLEEEALKLKASH